MQGRRRNGRVSRMLGRIPFLHVFVNGPGPVIHDSTLDLEGLVVFRHEKDGPLAPLYNIPLGFVKEIIGHNQRVVAELADTRDIDGVRPAVLINSG